MNYLRELSFREILSGCFSVYYHNFFTILIIFALPVYPMKALESYLTLHGISVVSVIFLIIEVILISLPYAAITVALSDVCLGNKPSVIRSYKFVFNPIIWKLIATNLLQTIAIAVGIILFIIPGVIFILWFVFVTVVVILEGSWGVAALKRSKALGKGFYLRTFGLLLTMTCLFSLLGGVVGASLAWIEDTYLRLLILGAILTLMQPLVFIMLVLSYYDLRARKESYDTAALAEDLQH